MRTRLAENVSPHSNDDGDVVTVGAHVDAGGAVAAKKRIIPYPVPLTQERGCLSPEQSRAKETRSKEEKGTQDKTGKRSLLPASSADTRRRLDYLLSRWMLRHSARP